MSKQLIGIDVSHHNSKMADLHDVNALDFVIMKATEGKSYRDRSLPVWLAHLDDNILKGVYHFCRADLHNSPIEEALNFLGMVEYALDGKTLIALDIEAGSLRVKNIDEWALVWCEFVYNQTGIKPLIYCSESEVKRFKKCAEWGCGLWVAKWSNNKPDKIKPFKVWAIWQKTNNYLISRVKCDLDVFNGTREQYLKYCEDMRHGKSKDEDSNSSGD